MFPTLEYRLHHHSQTRINQDQFLDNHWYPVKPMKHDIPENAMDYAQHFYMSM